MKVISDEDLLSLHYQIEKAEVKQKKLEEQLDRSSDQLRKSKRSTRVLGISTVALLLFSVFLLTNSFYKAPKNKDIAGQIELASIQSELNSLKNELIQLEEEKVDMEVIKDLYLYRDLIDKDTVYSVQINSFNDNSRVKALSEKFINGRVYSDSSFFKLSLGIFETLEEAQEFRKTLMKSGFSKRIFVISYKDGKRVRIENPS